MQYKMQYKQKEKDEDLSKCSSLFFYCKNSCLKSRTQIKSSHPKTGPIKVAIKQTTRRTMPPFFKKVDHLTASSTIQLTKGMRSRMSCTKRLCLLNQVTRRSSYVRLDAVGMRRVARYLLLL